MHPIRKKRFWAVIVLICGSGIAISLVLYALKQNINLYFTPSQVVLHQAPVGNQIRLGGMVEKGSLHFQKQGMKISFALTDGQHQVEVYYHGILPDLFREGQGIVTEGQLDSNGIFMANQVLAKHDEKYMPKQLEKKGQNS